MSKVAIITAPAVASHEVAAHLSPIVRVVFYRLVPAAAVMMFAQHKETCKVHCMVNCGDDVASSSQMCKQWIRADVLHH